MRRLLLVVTAGLLIAGVVSAVVVRSARPGPSYAAVDVPLVVRSDDRTLVIQTSNAGGPCTGFPALTAHENAERVTVALQYPPPLPKSTSCSLVLNFGPASVVLQRPVGSRRIVNRTGPLTVITERSMPQFGPSSAGYHLRGLVAQGDEFAPTGISRTYRSSTAPAITAVVSRAPIVEGPEDVVTGRTTITGRPATVHEVQDRGRAFDRRVVWQAYGWSIEVGSDPRSPSTLVPLAVLTAFARAVGPPVGP